MRKISSAVALRLKLMSGLDISEKRLPQDGRFNIKVRANPGDVRISTLPTQFGESVVMRLLNQEHRPAGTGQDRHAGARARAFPPCPETAERHGAGHRPNRLRQDDDALRRAETNLNSPEKKVITVEDPVEYRLSGLNQVQVHEKIDLSFSRVLRTVLRQDPDIVLIGEMRDQETAQISPCGAAITGHLVLVHTAHQRRGGPRPSPACVDMGVPRYMVALSVHMVVAQRLVRVDPRHPAKPRRSHPASMERSRYELGDQVDSHAFHHGRGRTHCANTGYQANRGL